MELVSNKLKNNVIKIQKQYSFIHNAYSLTRKNILTFRESSN